MRDESYILDLCDEILGMRCIRQHSFDFLRGDSGRKLPVDGYYSDIDLVVEYRERQHLEGVPLFDRRQTVSGVPRSEQRRIYDQRRRLLLPKHNIRLVELTATEFPHTSGKRLRRIRDKDIELIRKRLAPSKSIPAPGRIVTFAYGSNMLTARLKERVSSATAIGVAQLRGHVLRWHKRSVDLSGKCDVEETGKGSDVVWGVLFELDASEKGALDTAEGLNNGYAEKEVGVLFGSHLVETRLYVATKKNPSLLPYHWYKAFVVGGAKEHNLPQSYVALLEAAESIADPQVDRSEANTRLLLNGRTAVPAIAGRKK